MMFDKNKPYGELHGKNVKYRYIQDEKFYLLDGTEVDEAGDKIKSRIIPKTEVKAKAKVKADVND